MPTAATLSFQSLSVTSSAVNSWQHCNPANRFGRRDRREFADVRFWVSLASYSCSLGGAFASGNCPAALSNLQISAALLVRWQRAASSEFTS